MNSLMSTQGYYGSELPSFGGAGAQSGQFTTSQDMGLTREQLEGLIKQQKQNFAQQRLTGATSGLGVQQYNAIPMQSLMSIAQGGGQQPYQDFMPQEYQFLQGLMGG